MEQYDIFGGCKEPEPDRPKVDKRKRNWENGFQRWSDNQAQESGTPLGKCGYGSMCDYCENNTYGRPCVRALNEMLREKNIQIDYEKQSYENAWEGVFK